jgi:hypothetical protein
MGQGEALTTQPPLTPRLKKEYSSDSTPLLCLHGRLLGEFFVTFTLLKVIDMVLLLIFSHEKLVESIFVQITNKMQQVSKTLFCHETLQVSGTEAAA